MILVGALRENLMDAAYFDKIAAISKKLSDDSNENNIIVPGLVLVKRFTKLSLQLNWKCMVNFISCVFMVKHSLF
jgi:hypothetical protein